MEFNIGDWIECNYANGTRIVAQVSSENKIRENGLGQEFPTSFTEGSGWVKWNPKIGDFVIPNFVSQDSFRVVRVLTEPDNLGSFQSDVGLLDNRSCEPFIGKLPSFVKKD